MEDEINEKKNLPWATKLISSLIPQYEPPLRSLEPGAEKLCGGRALSYSLSMCESQIEGKEKTLQISSDESEDSSQSEMLKSSISEAFKKDLFLERIRVRDSVMTVGNSKTHTAEDVIHTTEDVIHTTEDVMHTTEDVIHTTEDVIHTTEDVIHTTKDVIHRTEDVAIQDCKKKIITLLKPRIYRKISTNPFTQSLVAITHSSLGCDRMLIDWHLNRSAIIKKITFSSNLIIFPLIDSENGNRLEDSSYRAKVVIENVGDESDISEYEAISESVIITHLMRGKIYKIFIHILPPESQTFNAILFVIFKFKWTVTGVTDYTVESSLRLLENIQCISLSESKTNSYPTTEVAQIDKSRLSDDKKMFVVDKISRLNIEELNESRELKHSKGNSTQHHPQKDKKVKDLSQPHYYKSEESSSNIKQSKSNDINNIAMNNIKINSNQVVEKYSLEESQRATNVVSTLEEYSANETIKEGTLLKSSDPLNRQTTEPVFTLLQEDIDTSRLCTSTPWDYLHFPTESIKNEEKKTTKVAADNNFKVIKSCFERESKTGIKEDDVLKDELIEKQKMSDKRKARISVARLKALRQLSGEKEFSLIVKLKEDKYVPIEFSKIDNSSEITASFVMAWGLKDIFIDKIKAQVERIINDWVTLSEEKILKKAKLVNGSYVLVQFIDIVDLF